jgi:hypothetical protein
VVAVAATTGTALRPPLPRLDPAVGSRHWFGPHQRNQPRARLEAPRSQRSYILSATLIARQLAFGRDTVVMTVGDFSEAELLVRPVPAANHPYWQLGHLCDIEVNIVNSIRAGVLAELPADFRERFSSRQTKDDAALPGFGKEELLSLFGANREKTIALVKELTAEELDAASREDYAHIAPQLTDLLMLIVHQGMMHAGQMQVARRKLGKPILY